MNLLALRVGRNSLISCRSIVAWRRKSLRGLTSRCWTFVGQATNLKPGAVVNAATRLAVSFTVRIQLHG
jgi:hypothetical protein